MPPSSDRLFKVVRAGFWLLLIVGVCWVAWNLAIAGWNHQGSYRGRSGGMIPFLFFIGMGGVASLYCLGQLVAVFVPPKPRQPHRSRRR